MQPHDPARADGPRPYPRFGERLQAARIARGMTPQDLGILLRKDSTFVNRWEREDMNPLASSIRTLAVALDVSVDYLLGLTDDLDPIGARPTASADALSERDEASRAEERHRPDRRRGERRAR